VEQGHTKTLTTTVTNAGDADLTISSISFASGAGNKFTATPMAPPTQTVHPNQKLPIRVSYTPPVPGLDADELRIGNNDPKTMGVVKIPVSGGAVPKLLVSPSDMMVFALPNPPPPPPVPPRSLPITLANVGYGDLKIQRLEIRGPNDDPMHPSVDDFTIMECAAMPAPVTGQACDLDVTLCAPSDRACRTSQKTFTIVYKNLHIFTTDFAQLHIRSNDPADLDHVVVLQAHDVPCLYPTPAIRVDTARPCKGQPVTLTGRGSDPGGGGMGRTMINRYEWQFAFAPPPTPDFMPMEGIQVNFTPQTAGIYIVDLDVTNDCGARSQNSASETINVSETCN
jgi:hypothetical protein